MTTGAKKDVALDGKGAFGHVIVVDSLEERGHWLGSLLNSLNYGASVGEPGAEFLNAPARPTMVVVGDLDRGPALEVAVEDLQRRFPHSPWCCWGTSIAPPAPFPRPLMLRSLAFCLPRRSSSILRSFSRKRERSSMRRTILKSKAGMPVGIRVSFAFLWATAKRSKAYGKRSKVLGPPTRPCSLRGDG